MKKIIIDLKKKEKRMPEIKMHMGMKARLETLNNEETGKLVNLQRLVRSMQKIGAVSASSEGGKRRKTTTRKQKGRRTTKKQNKNKKSRKH